MVIPVKTGIQGFGGVLDTRLRGYDEEVENDVSITPDSLVGVGLMLSPGIGLIFFD